MANSSNSVVTPSRSMSADAMDTDSKVWGMPTYDHNQLDNLTDEDYLAAVLGPKNVGLPLLIPITVLYLGIFVTGVVGNVAVCLVIVKNKSMHTATNYYLFSLAISDLILLLLGLPNDLAIYWQQYPWLFGEILCKGRSLVSEMTSYSSVLTIVAFSMERYLAICHPLYSHTMSGFKRAVRIIALVWIVSLLASIPYAVFTRLNYIDRPLGSKHFLPESAFCALLDDNIYPKNYPVYELSSFIFFIFPMGILVILYIRMGLRIRDTNGIQRNFSKRPRPDLIPGQKASSSQLLKSITRHSCLCKRGPTPSTSQATEDDAEAPLNPNRHRDSSCPANCMLHPAPTGQPALIRNGCVSTDSASVTSIVSIEEQGEQDTGFICCSSSHKVRQKNAGPKVDKDEEYVACKVCSSLVNLTQIKSQPKSDDTDSFTPRVRSDKRSITILLAAVVLAFFICWAPFHAQRLCYVYFKESKFFRTLNEYLYYISGFLYYFSATVNPVLYNLMSLKYRHAFKQTLCRSRKNRKGCLSLKSTRNPVNQSYTFRSSAKTVLEVNSSENHCIVSKKNIRHKSKKALHRFGLRRWQRDSLFNLNNLHEVGDGLGDENSFNHSNRRRSKGFYARSDFRAAMRSAQNAFSDIAEEDSYQSSSNQSCLKMTLPVVASFSNVPEESDLQHSQKGQGMDETIGTVPEADEHAGPWMVPRIPEAVSIKAIVQRTNRPQRSVRAEGDLEATCSEASTPDSSILQSLHVSNLQRAHSALELNSVSYGSHKNHRHHHHYHRRSVNHKLHDETQC